MSELSGRAAAWFCVWGSATVGMIVLVVGCWAGGNLIGALGIYGALAVSSLAAVATAFWIGSHYRVSARFMAAVVVHLAVGVLLLMGFGEVASHFSLPAPGPGR